MRLTEIPFNISILNPSPELLRTMQETKALDIFEPGTNNLKSDGLFSVETFGALGSKERDAVFSYIKLNTTVFHPLIFKRLGVLKKLYHDICTGRRYAIFDEEEKDFIASDELQGETGFAFFVKHFSKLKLKSTDSPLRNLRIRLIEENAADALQSHILVMPAGLRDIHVEVNSGRTTEDEINKIYRSILATASTISATNVNRNDPVIDVARMSIQRSFEGIFDSIFSLIKGKQGYALGRWASRKVRNGTANVITPMEVSVNQLGTKRTPGINDIQVGLFQMLKAALPVAIFHVRTGFIAQVLPTDGSTEATLTNRKTLKAERVNVAPEEIERWITFEGVEKEIQRFGKKSHRQRPIVIDDHYLGLLYAGKEGFRFFSDIDDLPASFDKKLVFPINLTSLLYLSGYRKWGQLAGVLTRYPVTGAGSTYIGNAYVKTTTENEEKKELDENWEPIGGDYVCYQFPSQLSNASFIETLSPHPSRLVALGGDYDGDRCTFTVLYGDKTLLQFTYLKSRKEWYLSSSGGLGISAKVDNLELVLRNITGGPTA